MKIITVRLTDKQLDLVLAALAELPLKVSYETYNHIYNTAIEALNPKSSEAS